MYPFEVEQNVGVEFLHVNASASIGAHFLELAKCHKDFERFVRVRIRIFRVL
ncbi:hypothetical protein D3C85_1760370 [compost metagenome]